MLSLILTKLLSCSHLILRLRLSHVSSNQVTLADISKQFGYQGNIQDDCWGWIKENKALTQPHVYQNSSERLLNARHSLRKWTLQKGEMKKIMSCGGPGKICLCYCLSARKILKLMFSDAGWGKIPEIGARRWCARVAYFIQGIQLMIRPEVGRLRVCIKFVLICKFLYPI